MPVGRQPPQQRPGVRDERPRRVRQRPVELLEGHPGTPDHLAVRVHAPGRPRRSGSSARRSGSRRPRRPRVPAARARHRRRPAPRPAPAPRTRPGPRRPAAPRRRRRRAARGPSPSRGSAGARRSGPRGHAPAPRWRRAAGCRVVRRSARRGRRPRRSGRRGRRSPARSSSCQAAPRRLAGMSVRRIMGTETEFGISVQGQPTANPMVASSQVVNAYASSTLKARRARWDFEEESPLRDARGFDMSREVADPTQLTDEDLGLANVILTNGARLYVDHAHPEYSTPECTNPRDVVKWDKAGEQVALDASRFAAAIPGATPIVLYKNNTDNKGASYGAHENYLMRRSTPFARDRPAPHAVLRQPAGGVRRRPGRHRPGRPRARLPGQPARRLLRGRGRARDDAQAADHQHPRRAARRPREVPPPARDHRRRQPRRDLHLPQGRHHLAGARDDRGPVHRHRPRRRAAGAGAARRLPRPVA